MTQYQQTSMNLAAGGAVERVGAARGVLWWTPAVDITRAVVDAYNAKSGVAAPGGVPAAPTPNTPGH